MHSAVVCSDFHHLFCSGTRAARGWTSSAPHPDTLKYSERSLAAAFRGRASVRRPSRALLTALNLRRPAYKVTLEAEIDASRHESAAAEATLTPSHTFEDAVVALYSPAGSDPLSSSSIKKCSFSELLIKNSVELHTWGLSVWKMSF